jgi:hypothetical protein
MTRVETLADLVCSRVRRNLTLEEWRQLVGDPEQIPYQSTCPNLPPGEGAPSSIATPAVTPIATSVEDLATPATRPTASA